METLKKLLNAAEKDDWTCIIYTKDNKDETYRADRNYVEMSKYSPAGEDFGMVIDFTTESPAHSFLKDLKEYADTFDVDEHVELFIPGRGKNGCPSSIKTLVKDAEDIQTMIYNIYYELAGLLTCLTK